MIKTTHATDNRVSGYGSECSAELDAPHLQTIVQASILRVASGLRNGSQCFVGPETPATEMNTATTAYTSTEAQNLVQTSF